MASSSYNTKQKQLILNFLKNNHHRLLTCDEISENMKRNGTPVGKTTVYRYVLKLKDEGMVRRIIDENDKIARFQYIDEALDCDGHMHLRCLSCGDFHHLSCDFMEGVSRHLSEHHSFRIDNKKTVIYGLCEKCSEKQEFNYVADKL